MAGLGTAGGRVRGARARARTTRQLRSQMVAAGLVAAAVIFMLAPTARASSSTPMRVMLNKVRLSNGRLPRREPRTDSDRARPAIVGGSQIAIGQAPWQVEVIAVLSETEGLLCGGSILNQTEVLTAGHCVYDPETEERIPADQIYIIAGTSDFEELGEPDEEESVASGVRVHPDYFYDLAAPEAIPDDVAVLKLETPFALNASVKEIGLVPKGSLLQEGTLVNLTGFGEENPSTGELNGELRSIGMTLGFSRQCGGESNALFLCASAPNGSDCFGDSGSALTLPGSPATQVGVTDTLEIIEGRPCVDGAVGGFANVAAPEIRDFIEGDPVVPLAPRGGGAVIQGVPTVGYALSCAPGAWTGAPTFRYVFANGATGTVLQAGASSIYPLSSANVGESVFCEVQASTSGGTGIGRTLGLGPIQRSRQEEEAAARSKQEEEASVAKKHEEELAAAAAKKRQEEEAAKGGVLAAKEGPPDATITNRSVQAGSLGTIGIKIACPTGEVSCTGTVTLRTLDAVIAGVAGAAKVKPTILTLGACSFTVAGGKVKLVTLHLSGKARAARAPARSARTGHDPRARPLRRPAHRADDRHAARARDQAQERLSSAPIGRTPPAGSRASPPAQTATAARTLNRL
jgi:Trypsin